MISSLNLWSKSASNAAANKNEAKKRVGNEVSNKGTRNARVYLNALLFQAYLYKIDLIIASCLFHTYFYSHS